MVITPNLITRSRTVGRRGPFRDKLYRPELAVLALTGSNRSDACSDAEQEETKGNLRRNVCEEWYR